MARPIPITVFCCVLAGAALPDPTGGAPQIEGPTESILFLVGDGGDPALPDGDPLALAPVDPVLSTLLRDAASARAEVGAAGVVIAYLGDNVYEAGIPDPDAPGHADAIRRLEAQAAVAAQARVRAIFVPGNHDWADSGDTGLDSVRRQGDALRRIAQRTGATIAMHPQAACPGPEVIDVGAGLRLLVMDTQWWLHEAGRPEGPGSGCVPHDAAGVVDTLRRSLDDGGTRFAVVLAHHPLVTGGRHAWRPWILSPTIEWLGFEKQQETTSRLYMAMTAALRPALEGRPLDLWAAGHDHSLQVIDGDVPDTVVVSGSASRLSVVGPVAEEGYRSLYYRRARGWIRLEVTAMGAARLTVHEVASDGTVHEAFRRDLGDRRR